MAGRRWKRRSVALAIGAAGALLAVAPGASAAPAWSVISFRAPAGASNLWGVSCWSKDGCVAVGGVSLGEAASAPAVDVAARPKAASGTAYRPLAEEWNGRLWSRLPTPNLSAALYSVSCTSRRDCVVAGAMDYGHGGFQDALLWHWNGSRWSKREFGPSNGYEPAFLAVSCASARFCVAVGNLLTESGESPAGRVEIWNGHDWRPSALPGVENGSPVLDGVSCSSAKACTAVGENAGYIGSSGNSTDPALIYRWDGRRWRSQASPIKQAQLSSVSCWARYRCTAVGTVYRGSVDQQTREVVETWSGNKWSTVRTASRQHAALYGVACSSAGACAAVGAYQLPVTQFPESGQTLVQAGTGHHWAMQLTPRVRKAQRALYQVACPAPDFCVGVGVRGNDRGLIESD